MGIIQPYLPQIWAVLLGGILFLYVALDGFGLGVGIISLFTRDEGRRAVMMNSVGSVWHINQTWLVILGGLLFGAFPLAYGVVLNALYLPLMFMFFGLIGRGAAFEFREQARKKLPWSLAFGGGSLMAALAQGLAFGGWLGGLPVTGQNFAWSVWGWLTPLSFLTALGVASGYVLLGAAYLIMKTEGDLQRRCFPTALAGGILAFLTALVATFWVPRIHPFAAQKWTAWPGAAAIALPALFSLAAFALLMVSLIRRRERAPFVWSVLLILFLMLALAAQMNPYLIPPSVTAAQAAAAPGSLSFMLIFVGALLPFILAYNAYAYRVFRGKTREGY